MSERESDFGAFLSGFVVGGLVGAVVALLMAPQSGEETRTAIRDRSIELRDMAYDRAGEVRERAGEAVHQARVRSEEALQDVRSRAGEIAGATREKVTDLQRRGQVVLEEQKDKLSSAFEAGKKAVRRKGAAADPAEDGDMDA